LIGLGLVVSGLGLGLGLAFFGLGLGLGLALCGLVNITVFWQRYNYIISTKDCDKYQVSRCSAAVAVPGIT